MDECFTELLEERFPETDVIAMGVPGYGTAQELLLYEREGSKFDPDLVLLVFVRNDPGENLERRGRPAFRLEDGELLPPREPVGRRKSAASEWLIEHSRLYARLVYATQVGRQRLKMLKAGTRLDRPRDYVPLTPEEKTEAWALTDALLLRLRERVTAGGAGFAVVLAPSPEETREHMRALCAAHDLTLLDLTPAIEAAGSAGIEVRLRDDPHLSPAGQRVVADAIEAFLR
jgi:hypothetical protein